jgi:hypothetical protein
MLPFCTKTVRLMLGVAQQFQQFVAGGNGRRRSGIQIADGEYLTNGETFSGEVVVAESVSLIGVVKQNNPPTAVGWFRALADDGQLGVRAPDRAEAVGDSLLQRRDAGCDIRVGPHGALVDDGDLDSGVGLEWLGLSPVNKFGERAALKLRASVGESLYADQERENDFAVQKCHAVPIWNRNLAAQVREPGPINRPDKV